jgi:hypothetical protein
MYLIIYNTDLAEVLCVIGICVILITFKAHFNRDFNLNWVISPILSRKKTIYISIFEVKNP